MDDYRAFLIIEQSHSEPTAQYHVVDEATFKAAEAQLANEGWLDTPVVPLKYFGVAASFSKIEKLMKFLRTNEMDVVAETRCWNADE